MPASREAVTDATAPIAGALELRERVRATRLEAALDWAAGLAPAPLALLGSCCGMSLSQGGDVFERLGTGPPASSIRTADLLIVAGSISRRQVPLLRQVYDRMLEPRWVIAWGVCAVSGGAYDNYATIPGLDRILPVDVAVPGCPPAPATLRAALEALRSGEARRSRERGEWPILRARVASGSSDAPVAREGSGHVDRG